MTKALTAVLRRCLHLGDIRVVHSALERLSRVDFQAVQTYFSSTDTRIGPLLYSHLARLDVADRLPAYLLQCLHQHYLRNRCRTAILRSQLARLAREASERGIELLLIKGAAALVDGNASSDDGFVLGDLDVVVRPDDLARTRDLLLGLGYQLTEEDNLEGMMKEGFLSADGLVAIDLHTDLFWTGCRVVYSSCFKSDYRRHSVAASIDGIPVHTLAHEDAVTYQIAHDLIAHPQGLLWTTTARLYRLCRLIRYEPQAPGWRRTIGRAQNLALEKRMLAYVRYACSELGVRVPGEWQLPETRREEMWLRATADAPRSIRADCHSLFFSLENNRRGHVSGFLGKLAGSWKRSRLPRRSISWLPRRWAVLTISLAYVLAIHGLATLRFNPFFQRSRRGWRVLVRGGESRQNPAGFNQTREDPDVRC